MVVAKPSGLVCTPDDHGGDRDSLLEWLRRSHPTATLVNRIDAETSGIVLVALSHEAMSHLSQQFENRTVKKYYIAYVGGSAMFETMDIDRPVGPVLRRGLTHVRRKGKPSQTHLIRERNYRGFARLCCIPKTGRTHQIRIHLSDIGLPILGDTQHGGALVPLSAIKKNYHLSRKREDRKEAPLIRRVALHSHRICYIPYLQDEAITITSEEPADMQHLARQLERYA